MGAGGPAGNARLPEMWIERGERKIWEGAALQQAIIDGRTIDQMSLRAGDHLIVPAAGSGGFGGTLRMIGTTVAPIALLIATLLRIF